VPISQALDAPWPKESTHKFRLLRDPKAAREFEGGTFRLASVDEFPASKTMSGGLMIINKGKQRNLHWHTNTSEWHYYLRGKGQVALFGSGGRSKLADVKAGDAIYIAAGFAMPSRTLATTISRSCRSGTTASLRRLTSTVGCGRARTTCWQTISWEYPRLPSPK
jgi:mannose-6-phosphate isomerase-like protein (cupin superfamily)